MSAFVEGPLIGLAESDIGEPFFYRVFVITAGRLLARSDVRCGGSWEGLESLAVSSSPKIANRHEE